VLLLPHPLFSGVYLAALRAGWLEPSFVPPLIAAAAPLGSGILFALGLARGAERRRNALLLIVAVLEMLWAVTVLAIVGFAIAARSG
jgi:hypothetical protein